MINYLIKKKDIIKLFGDFYYIKEKSEINSNTYKYQDDPLKLISKVLEIMNVSDWYFGLYTALSYHNITLEKNPTECLICSNSPFNSRKFKILGKKMQVFVLNKPFFNSYLKKNGVIYSNLEKTFLDFVYFWKLNDIPDYKILKILNKYQERISKDKIIECSSQYSDEIQQIIEKLYVN